MAVKIEFDPVKNEENLEKHRISLKRAADMDIHAFIPDDRYEEPRYRLYGLIDGKWYCAAAADRGDRQRIISLRRAHLREVQNYVDIFSG